MNKVLRRLIFSASAIVLAIEPAAMAAEVQAGETPSGSPAHLTLGPLTVTATRTETPVADAPATVSVIPSQQIDENLVTDIKDLVRYEPGVSVRSSPSRFSAALSATGRDRNSGFNIRGLEGNRVLIQTDGIRVPDAFSFGPQSVGRGDYVDLDLLKSVEILRGPASALYGSDGVAGAVSFITKDPIDFLRGNEDWHVEGKAGFTSADESWAKGAVLAGRSGEWQGMVAYTRRDGHELDNKGENDSANTDRTTPNPQDIFSNAVLAKILLLPAEGHRLRLTYDHDDRDIRSNVLSAIAKPPLASTSTLGLLAHDNSDRDRVSLDHRYEGGGGFIETANWAAYYQRSHTRQFSAEDRNTAADRTRDSTFDNRVIGFNAQAESRIETGMLSHHFVYGGDISVARQTGLRDGTVPPGGESFPTRAFPNTDYMLAGLFAQDEITVFDDRLSLFPALRFDSFSIDPKADALLTGLVPASQNGSHLSPKVGALFKATPLISVFANYSSGFKAPSPSQVNNAFSNLIANYQSIPNPDLKPETSDSIEGGVRLNGEHWRVAATGFAGWYDNFIDQVQIGGTFTPTDPGIFQYVNLGSVAISGIELKGEARFESGFGGIVALSYARGDATTDGVKVPLDSVDPVKLVGGLTYRDPAERFGGQLIGTYSSAKDSSRIGAICTPACFATPSFFILDATAYWNFNEAVTVRAGIFNIFDEKYWWWGDVRGLSTTSVARDAYSQPGRNFAISLTARL